MSPVHILFKQQLKLIHRLPMPTPAVWLQGYACSAVQQLLTSTEFAQGVHAVAQSFGAVVKSLENLSLRQVSTQLGKAAQQLVFVQQCWTRIVLNSTLADVTRQNAPQQASDLLLGCVRRSWKLLLAAQAATQVSLSRWTARCLSAPSFKLQASTAGAPIRL